MAKPDEQKPARPDVRPLLTAGLAEAACILAGLLVYFLTGNALWIVIGVLAGVGFSGPAVIRYVRQSKDHDRASR